LGAVSEPKTLEKSVSHDVAPLLCGAEEINFAPHSNKLIAKTKTQFTVTQNPMFQFSQFALVDWPSAGGKLQGMVLPFIGRTIGMVSEKEFTTITSDGKILRITLNPLSSKNVLVTEVGSVRRSPEIFRVSDYATAHEIQRSYEKFTWSVFRRSLSEKSFQVMSPFAGVQHVNLSREGFLLLFADDRMDTLRVSTDSGKASQSETGIPRFFANDLQLGLSTGRGIQIEGRGLFTKVRPNNTTAIQNLPVEMYSKRVSTSSPALQALRYTPNGVSSDLRSSSIISRVNKEVQGWKAAGWYVYSAAVSEREDKAVLKFKGFEKISDGEYEETDGYSFIDLNYNVSQRYRCAQTLTGSIEPVALSSISPRLEGNENALNQLDMQKKSLDVTLYTKFVEYGGLGFWHIKKNEAVGKLPLVVFLRGGSASSLYGLPLSRLEQGYIDRGFEVVRAEYSGAVGASLSLFIRLLQNREMALNSDAQTIAKYLSRNPKMKDAVLIGDSFGSVLAGRIAKQNPTLFHRIILTAPFLSWNPERDYSELDKTSKIEQLEFDRWTYGAPKDLAGSQINSTLSLSAQSLCNAENLVVVIGGRDRLSAEMDWRRLCGRENVVVIFEDSGHAVIDDPRIEQLFQGLPHDPLPSRRH
jgi:hypothetical protein